MQGQRKGQVELCRGRMPDLGTSDTYTADTMKSMKRTMLRVLTQNLCDVAFVSSPKYCKCNDNDYFNVI